MLMILHTFYHCRLGVYIFNIHHKFVHKMEETDRDIQLLGVGNMSEVFSFLIYCIFQFFSFGYVLYACNKSIINFLKSEHY